MMPPLTCKSLVLSVLLPTPLEPTTTSIFLLQAVCQCDLSNYLSFSSALASSRYLNGLMSVTSS